MENLKENASTTFAEEKKEYIYTCKIILYAMTIRQILLECLTHFQKHNVLNYGEGKL